MSRPADKSRCEAYNKGTTHEQKSCPSDANPGVRYEPTRRVKATTPGFDPSDCTFGNCELTLDDFTHAVANEPRTRELIRWATAGGCGACVAGLGLISGPRDLAGVALLGFGLLCFATHQAPEHIARRWYERTPREARSLRYTLNSRELIVSSEVSRQAYAWPSLLGYHEAPLAFLLWVSPRMFVILPKRAFATEELGQIRSRLERQEIGAPPSAPRFWLWVVLTAALGAAALALWNRFAPR